MLTPRLCQALCLADPTQRAIPVPFLKSSRTFFGVDIFWNCDSPMDVSFPRRFILIHFQKPSSSQMPEANERLHLIQYAILQATNVPSLLCDLLVFAHFIRRWRTELFAAPQNHVILCLLIVSFVQKTTDVPFALYHLRWGVAIQQTELFCAMWGWLTYSTTTVSLHLLTWCCLERHLFVFHSTMMKQRRCLILLHYIPLAVTLFYSPSFYIVAIFLQTSCTNSWDYTISLCGSPCYNYLPVWGTVDWLFHCAFPIMVTVLANVLLFTRVIWQNVRQQRAVQWRRQRRLIVQLALISGLFLILLTPLVTVGVIQALWIPTFLMDIQYEYLFYMPYFTSQFLPCVIVGSLPRMHKELKEWYESIKRRLITRRRVRPNLGSHTITVNHDRAISIPLRKMTPTRDDSKRWVQGREQ